MNERGTCTFILEMWHKFIILTTGSNLVLSHNSEFDVLSSVTKSFSVVFHCSLFYAFSNWMFGNSVLC